MSKEGGYLVIEVDRTIEMRGGQIRRKMMVADGEFPGNDHGERALRVSLCVASTCSQNELAFLNLNNPFSTGFIFK